MKTRRNVRVLLTHNFRVLLMKVELPDRTFWCTIGGGIKEGETIVQAAQREVFEETGLAHNEIFLGPVIWEGSIVLERRGIETLHNEVFLIAQSASDRVSPGAMTVHEQEVVKEMKWWTTEELSQTSEFIVPPSLGRRLTKLAQIGLPLEVEKIDLGDDAL